jgi:hypothetical protein
MVVDSWCRLVLGHCPTTVAGEGWRRLVLDKRGHLGADGGPASAMLNNSRTLRLNTSRILCASTLEAKPQMLAVLVDTVE